MKKKNDVFHCTVSCNLATKYYIAMSVAGQQTIRSLGLIAVRCGIYIQPFSRDGEVSEVEGQFGLILFATFYHAFSSCFFSAQEMPATVSTGNQEIYASSWLWWPW